jgi:hypothetical protein
MRGRLIRIVSTQYTVDGRSRLDTLACGHTVEVRRPTSNKDKRSIEAAKFRRCPECVGKK